MLVHRELKPGMDPGVRQQVRGDIAACFQNTAVNHLVERVDRAMVWAKQARPDLTAMIVAGGVAANKRVRAELARVATEHGLEFLVPPGRLCVDNGVMVAWTGIERLKKGLGEKPPTNLAKAGLFAEVRPRWALGPRDSRSTPHNRDRLVSKREERRRNQTTHESGPKNKKAKHEPAASEE
eukprot:TRINITY_DN22892_c0_g1_i2.p1 TRINITY_DN22892_c0_g1~~TRINITY_DN22892_c0_g1_i2.p1  ORF type:complete len:181 (-),score=30.21 TRINITY_DN22892_c0_g1_i2:70-612(-)